MKTLFIAAALLTLPLTCHAQQPPLQLYREYAREQAEPPHPFEPGKTYNAYSSVPVARYYQDKLDRQQPDGSCSGCGIGPGRVITYVAPRVVDHTPKYGGWVVNPGKFVADPSIIARNRLLDMERAEGIQRRHIVGWVAAALVLCLGVGFLLWLRRPSDPADRAPLTHDRW